MPNRWPADVTPTAICQAKFGIMQQFSEDPVSPCPWGAEGFKGCEACRTAALADVTVAEAENDMLNFMWDIKKINH